MLHPDPVRFVTPRRNCMPHLTALKLLTIWITRTSRIRLYNEPGCSEEGCQMRTRFLLIVGAVSLLTAPIGANGPSFLSTLHHITTLTSTVPANGDVNP